MGAASSSCLAVHAVTFVLLINLASDVAFFYGSRVRLTANKLLKSEKGCGLHV